MQEAQLPEEYRPVSWDADAVMYSRATRLRPTARGIHVRSTRGAACACLVSAGARSAAGRPGMGSADYPIGQKRTETGRTRGGCTPEPGTATWSARRPSRREARIELRRSVHAVAQPPPAAPSGAERRRAARHRLQPRLRLPRRFREGSRLPRVQSVRLRACRSRARRTRIIE